MKSNETTQNEMKRNETKWNEMKWMLYVMTSYNREMLLFWNSLKHIKTNVWLHDSPAAA